ERVSVSNEYGTSLKPCPSFEQVIVKRTGVKGKKASAVAFSTELPMPEYLVTMTEKPWRVHMAGVGGMGIGLTSSILVKAGHYAGYAVSFNEKKGLAIRNGGIFSQVAWRLKGDDQRDPP